MIGRRRKRFTPFGGLDASVSLYPKESIIMQKRIVRRDEQIKLIMNAAKADFPIISGANDRILMLVLSITGSASSEKPVIPFLIPKVNPKER